jgi:hypothetical protein
MFKQQIEEIGNKLTGSEQMVSCLEEQLKVAKEDVRKLKQAKLSLEKLQGTDEQTNLSI